MREMRWNCFDPGKGCYRKLMPRLGMFDDCFPGKIGMSDVDGMVELGGRFLMLEFKSHGGRLLTAQRLAFQRMTEGSIDPMKFTVIVVFGDPETMEVTTLQVFSRGKGEEPEPCTLEELRSRIREWAMRAQRARMRPSLREDA